MNNKLKIKKLTPPKDLELGSIHETNKFGKIQVLEYRGATEILIRFLDNGFERNASADCIRKGRVKGIGDLVFQCGRIFPTNNYGDIEIVSYNACDDVEVRFVETGNVKTTSVAQIHRRQVRDIPYIKGRIFTTKTQGDIEILSYYNPHKVEVKFIETNNVVYVTAAKIKSGLIKDVMKPWVCGVGYLGKGAYVAGRGGTITSQYLAWRNMIARCYGDDNSVKNPTYTSCSVFEDWHNFQNFAKWFDKEYKSGYHLDKDILSEGNKVYSPSECVFVPQKINNFLTEHGNAIGNCPLGVHIDTCSGKYAAQVSNPLIKYTDGKAKKVHLGYFINKEEAHLAWAVAKLGILMEYIETGVLDYDERLKPALLLRYNNYLINAENQVCMLRKEGINEF